MSNIRDYVKAKEKRQKSDKKINYRERIRGHKLTIVYRIALVCMLTAGIIFALYIQWRDKVYSENIVSVSKQNSIVEGTNVLNLDGSIIYYSNDGISCTDIQGNARWNQTYEMQTPMIAVCQDIIAVGDYNGSNISVMNTEEKLGDINTNLPIRYFDVAANGEVIVVLDDGDVTLIRLYMADGQEIATYTTSMNESGYPVDVSISPNGKLVGISYLYVDSGVMRTSVAFYNHGAVGQNAINNFMSGYNYPDTIVPALKFMNNEAAFALSDNRIVFYEGSEKPVNIKDNLLNEEVRGVFYSEDYVGLIYDDLTGESLYRLDVYDQKGTLQLSKDFDFDYNEIVFNGDQIIVYNDLTCLISDINGTEKYMGPLNKSTALLMPTGSSSRYIAVTVDSIDILEFK
jgi:hypothetical protein